jgi:GntR family transcriptional regulator
LTGLVYCCILVKQLEAQVKKKDTKSFDLQLEVKSAVPIYEQIKNAIKMALFSGKLQEGDKIISIRELSTRNSVNPITIMKAYSQLETEGFLLSRRGAGYYIRIDREKVQEGKMDIFRKEISDVLKRIADLGFTVDQFLEELKKQLNDADMEEKKDDPN